MKCPCCGTEVADKYMVSGLVLVTPEGKQYRSTPGVLRILAELLNGPIDRSKIPHKQRDTFAVQLTKLRHFLDDNKLPFEVLTFRPTMKTTLVARRSPLNVEINNDAEHQKDVHS